MATEDVICMTLPIMAAMFAMAIVFMTRMKKVPPGKAMVIYGRGMAPGSNIGYRVMTRGGRLIMPIIESYEYMDISPRTIVVDLRNVRTSVGGVRVHIKGSLTYQIPKEDTMLSLAAEHLLSLEPTEVETITRNVIEGGIIGVVGGIDVKELETNPTLLSDSVRKRIDQALGTLGIQLDEIKFERVKTINKGGA